jgi:hypothetical protein
MSEGQTSREERIALQILRYMEEHPQAKDTIEGISQWWLAREAGEYRLADVERAVTRLVAKDLIVTNNRKGSARCYGANPRRLEAISKILKSS